MRCSVSHIKLWLVHLHCALGALSLCPLQSRVEVRAPPRPYHAQWSHDSWWAPRLSNAAPLWVYVARLCYIGTGSDDSTCSCFSKADCSCCRAAPPPKSGAPPSQASSSAVASSKDRVRQYWRSCNAAASRQRQGSMTQSDMFHQWMLHQLQPNHLAVAPTCASLSSCKWHYAREKLKDNSWVMWSPVRNVFYLASTFPLWNQVFDPTTKIITYMRSTR